MTAVTSEVSHWLPLVEKRANHYERLAIYIIETGRTHGLFNTHAGAEFDDLVQVGLLKVWKELEKGFYPDQRIIDRVMKNHLRDTFRKATV